MFDYKFQYRLRHVVTKLKMLVNMGMFVSLTGRRMEIRGGTSFLGDSRGEDARRN